MIIKGQARTLPQNLGTYLMTNEENERAELVEVRGTVSKDAPGALLEMDALAAGTQCEKPLYHAQISPEPPYRLTPEQRQQAVDVLEAELGFKGHPRIVVVHEKHDREHIHVVWTRVNPETMKVVPISFNYRKNEIAARELERQFGHPRVQGAHAERDGVERPERSPTRSELRQQQKTGISAKAVSQEVTQIFRTSDRAESFVAGLENVGYLLARGDRRDFVIIDHAIGEHSLGRRVDGIRAAELREFMKPIDRNALPSVAQAKEAQMVRSARIHPSEADRRVAITEMSPKKFQEEAIKREAKDKWKRRTDRASVKAFQEDAIKREAENSRKTIARSIAEKQDKHSGAGYQNQSELALKEQMKRDKVMKQRNRFRPQNPEDHMESIKRADAKTQAAGVRKRASDEILKRQADETTKSQQGERDLPGSMKAKSESTKIGRGKELDDRIQRLLEGANRDQSGQNEQDRDRHRKAPGGGRTRGR